MKKRLALWITSLAACASLGFAAPSWSSEEVRLSETQLDQTVAGTRYSLSSVRQTGLVNVNESFNKNNILSGNNVLSGNKVNVLNNNNTAIAAGVGVFGIGANANASSKSY